MAVWALARAPPPLGPLSCLLLVVVPGPCLAPQEAMNIFCQLLLGLRHVHSNKILHRDLKVVADQQAQP